MKPFYITYLICGQNFSDQKLLSRLSQEHITAQGIVRQGNELTLSVSIFDRHQTEKIFGEFKAESSIAAKGAGVKFFGRLKERAGLFIGAAVCTAALIAVQMFVVNIEVLTDNETLRKQITEALEQNGVKPGAYIPKIERSKVERKVRQSVEGISWAGITLADSTVIVDIVEDIPQPDFTDDRLPTNLVAEHDAVIDKFEVLNGCAVETVGSGVVAGEVLVSGEVPVERVTRDKEGRPQTERSEKYVRSIGRVWGTFTVSETFTQSLSETQIVYSPKKYTRRKLKIFSARLPLYFESSEDEGLVSRSEKVSVPELFGEPLPVGIVRETLTPYGFETTLCTPEQAAARVKAAAKRYERNFLDKYEIRSRTEKLSQTDSGAALTVTYELYGVISREETFEFDGELTKRLAREKNSDGRDKDNDDKENNFESENEDGSSAGSADNN